MTPMQKIEEAWHRLHETGDDLVGDLMSLSINAKQGDRTIGVPYITSLGQNKYFIRVMDFTPNLVYEDSLSGWYTLDQFKKMIEENNFELVWEA